MDDILVPYSSCPLLVQLLRWTVRLTKEGLLKIQRECFCNFDVPGDVV